MGWTGTDSRSLDRQGGLVLNLIILNGPHKGDAIAISNDRPTILGRQGDVTLKDSRVSRKHAEVRNEGGTWVITDLGSSNGTLVNGKRISKLTELEEGDQIQMGRYLVVVGHMDVIEYENDPPISDGLDNDPDIASAVAASARDADDDALPDFDDLMDDDDQDASAAAAAPIAATPVDEEEHPLDDLLDADDSMAASAMAEPDRDGVYDLILEDPADTPGNDLPIDDEPITATASADEDGDNAHADDDAAEGIDTAPAPPVPQPMPAPPPVAALDIDDLIEDDSDAIPEMEITSDQDEEDDPADALARGFEENLDSGESGGNDDSSMDAAPVPINEDAEPPLEALADDLPQEEIEPVTEFDEIDAEKNESDLSLDDAPLPASVTDLDELDLNLEAVEAPTESPEVEADIEPDAIEAETEVEAKPETQGVAADHEAGEPLAIDSLDAALDDALADDSEPTIETSVPSDAIAHDASEHDAVDLIDAEGGYNDATVGGMPFEEPIEDDDAPEIVSLVAGLGDDEPEEGDDSLAARIDDDASVGLVAPVAIDNAEPETVAIDDDAEDETIVPESLVRRDTGWGKIVGTLSAVLVLLVGLGVGYYIVYGPGLTVTGRDDDTLARDTTTATTPTTATPEVTPPAPTLIETRPATTDTIPDRTATISPPSPDNATTPPAPASDRAAPPISAPDKEVALAPLIPDPAADTPSESDPPAVNNASPSAFSSGPSLIGESAIARSTTSSAVQWLDPPAPVDTEVEADPQAIPTPDETSPFQPVTSSDDVVTTESPTVDPTPDTSVDESIVAPTAEDAMAAAEDQRIDELTAAIGPPQRVVFLVDASGSLIDTFDQVLERVSLGVRGLLAEQEYTVIFFRRDQVIETPPAGLKPADPRNKRLTADWLAPSAGNVSAFGRSEIDEAIALALSYGADEITLFSDNALARSTASGAEGLIDQIEELCLAADEHPIIHTVQFVYEDPDNTLRRIAEAFDGNFIFIKSSYGNRSLLRRQSDELSVVVP